MYFQQFFVDGLGCASYLIGSESQGTAAVVDPERGVSRYLEAAQDWGLRITHIIETHLHADHVSGNTDLAARTGAHIYIHEAAGVAFPHKSLRDGDVLELGEVRIAVRHTPGHTPEGVTLLVVDTSQPSQPAVSLTGDTLFVGDVGRPDLVGAGAARDLAGQMYDSLFNNLLSLPDDLIVYPGHGAGSLCGKSIGAARSTTLGAERQDNPALQPRDKVAFVDFVTGDLPEQPGNHQRIKAINKRGPKPLGDIEPRSLSVRDAIRYFQRGAALLDTRPKAEYVEAHVPGSVHLEADDQLSNRAGFVLPPDVPLILCVRDVAAYRSAVLSLARVGYDDVAGYLADGIPGWIAAGLQVVSGDIEDITPAALYGKLKEGSPPVVVDVREPWEYAQGHVPEAVLIPLGQLANRYRELDPEKPVAVICQSGNRSQSAAALLVQKGFAKVYNVLGGTGLWAKSGLPISRN